MPLVPQQHVLHVFSRSGIASLQENFLAELEKFPPVKVVALQVGSDETTWLMAVVEEV
ncbi:MAG: hypothetical protein ABIQ01_09345 [Pseudolysinimonas sp.]